MATADHITAYNQLIRASAAPPAQNCPVLMLPSVACATSVIRTLPLLRLNSQA
jgi:hypothetical protein